MKENVVVLPDMPPVLTYATCRMRYSAGVRSPRACEVCVIVPVGEGVDERLELIDAAAVIGGVELVSPGRLGALDASVEVGPLGRRTTSSRRCRAVVFEDRHELGSAVDLDPLDLEGRAGEELVEQVLGGAGGCGGRDMADRPFGDRIVGGEVFDRPVGRH